MIVATLDPSIVITVRSRTPLLYATGEDSREDRPAFVRAASAIARWGEQLMVVQDDANWLASIDARGQVHPIALPRGEGDVRLFDDTRGNKHHKLDLEACTVVSVGERQVFLAFGSGSTAEREQVVMLDEQGQRMVTAHALYRSLRKRADFSGSELNLEGAVAIGDEVVLFNRGNGARTELRGPMNATCRIGAEALVQYLDDVSRPSPAVERVCAYELGVVDGTRLTFTDAARFGDRLVYVAAAEASPDAVQDGPVAGVAIGVLDHAPRYGLVREANGDLVCAKIEGLIHDRGRWLAVVDSDDATRPAELLELEVLGL